MTSKNWVGEAQSNEPSDVLLLIELSVGINVNMAH